MNRLKERVGRWWYDHQVIDPSEKTDWVPNKGGHIPQEALQAMAPKEHWITSVLRGRMRKNRRVKSSQGCFGKQHDKVLVVQGGKIITRRKSTIAGRKAQHDYQVEQQRKARQKSVVEKLREQESVNAG